MYKGFREVLSADHPRQARDSSFRPPTRLGRSRRGWTTFGQSSTPLEPSARPWSVWAKVDNPRRLRRHLPGAHGGAGADPGTPARAARARRLPTGVPEEEWRARLRRSGTLGRARLLRGAGTERSTLPPTEDFLEWFVNCQRFCASPGAALTFFRVYGETDLREILPTIRVPTLVLYRRELRERDARPRAADQGALALEIEGGGFRPISAL